MFPVKIVTLQYFWDGKQFKKNLEIVGSNQTGGRYCKCLENLWLQYKIEKLDLFQLTIQLARFLVF